MDCETEIPVEGFCNAWQPDHPKIPKIDEPAPSDNDSQDQFFIKFAVEFLYPPSLPLEDDEDYLLVICDLESSISFHHFWAPCKNLDREKLSWDDISIMLTKMRVPLHKQPSMLHRISACANEIANADHNRSRKILPMMVSIIIRMDYCCYKQEHPSTFVLRNNADVCNLMLIPASKKAVEGLKKETFVENLENDSLKQCMICLEKLGVGSEIISMPCSHVFGQDCILNWLKISNFCPLCRFQLSD